MTGPGVPVFQTPLAAADLVQAVVWLREHASPIAAEEFVNAVEETLEMLSHHPLAGSGLVGSRLRIPDLRSFRVAETSYILFYLSADERLDLIRVLHGRRDIEAALLAE